MGVMSIDDISFITVDTNEELGVDAPGFLLVPSKFGGGVIKEAVYEGTAKFGTESLLELLVDWNRESLSELITQNGDLNFLIKSYLRFGEVATSRMAKELYATTNYMHHHWKEELGYRLLKNRVNLKYPPKVARYESGSYEDYDRISQMYLVRE